MAAMTIMLIFFAASISLGKIVLGAALLVIGLLIAKQLHRNDCRFTALEILRLPLTLWLSTLLWHTPSSVQMTNSIEVKGTSLAVLNYASSPKYWPQWHPQSKQVYLNEYRPLLAGEQFEEDIRMPTGQAHLVWTVVKSQAGAAWQANAKNQSNGADIQIEYTVRQQANGTLFQRTLSYQLPNFGRGIVDALYERDKIEQSSRDSLLQFKVAAEHITNNPQ